MSRLESYTLKTKVFLDIAREKKLSEKQLDL